jgi:hypothetical protein
LIADGSKRRVEGFVGNAQRRVMVYDDAAKELVVLDVVKGTTSRMNADAANELDRSSQAPPDVRFEATGSRKKVSGRLCEFYRVFIGPWLRDEGCFPPWGPGVMSRSEGELMSKLMSGMQPFQRVRGERWLQAPGLPVEQRFFGSDGKSIESTFTLKSISREPVAPSASNFPVSANRP